MSSNSRSLINGQARLRTSSVVYPYDDQSVSEIDETRPLTSRNRSAKKVRICTCCGQCKGLRTVPKSSRLSFSLKKKRET